MGKKQEGKKQIGALLDEELYREIRSRAVGLDRPVGELIDEAITMYLDATPQVFRRTKQPVKPAVKSKSRG